MSSGKGCAMIFAFSFSPSFSTDKNAGILIKESELGADFETKCQELLSSTILQEKLSVEIKKLALENATKDIVDEIEKLIK